MSVTGMMTATATKRIMMIHKRTKAHKGMPQNLRGRYFSSKLGEPGTLWPLARPDLGKGEGHLEPGRSPVGVARDGEGKAASMSAMEPSREPFGDFSFSFASRMLRRPSRLAVFPRSRFEANFVARLINSGRLLELPRTSESLVAARFSRGGLLAFFVCCAGSGDVVLPVPIAPPFSRLPRIWLIRGSKDVTGVTLPELGALEGAISEGVGKASPTAEEL